MRTISKVILCSIMLPVISLGIVTGILYLLPSDLGLMLGVMLTVTFIVCVIVFGYPVWFKDYIENYQKREK